MSYQKQGALDVEACEDEPIRFIGAIQAPYALVAWRPHDRRLVAFSANLPALSGLPRDLIETGLGSGVDTPHAPARETATETGVDALFAMTPDALDRIGHDCAGPRPVRLINGMTCLARACTVGGAPALLLDPEAMEAPRLGTFDTIISFNTLIEDQLAQPRIDVAALADGLATAFRKVSGYDRVMVYAFDTDWHGTIIAEDAASHLGDRFKGLTFPSSDIPRPARALFLQNRVRPLIDIDAPTVPLLGCDGVRAETFDIGALPERAVSPIHLAYLRNMGVRATLTIALIVNGRLWGLLTCHHYAGPRKPTAADLSMCRVLCDLMSHTLARMADRKRMEDAAAIEELGRRLRADARIDESDTAFDTLLEAHAGSILDALSADGAMLSLDGCDRIIARASAKGKAQAAPSHVTLAGLRASMDAYCDAMDQTAFSSNELAAHVPDMATDLLPACAGAVMVRNAARSSALLAWRPAVRMTKTWAGDPHKRVVEAGPLSPRASFERWQEQTARTCTPWPGNQQGRQEAVMDILAETGRMLANRRSEREAHAARQEAERAMSALEHASMHDVLTNLPNRRYLDRVLDEAMAPGAAPGAERIAALHIDLDRFKAINDTLGHAAGDAVLVHVADTLQRRKRATDFIARVGGDEFVLIAREGTSEEQLGALAQDLIDALSRPIRIDEEQVSFGASVGIAITPRAELKPQALLSRADIALYESKRAGRGRHRFVSDAMEQARIERRALGEDVRRGFEAGEFELHFQPQFRAADREIAGAEALLRWNHPTRGLLAPNAFMEAAEEVGVLERLDAFSVRSALRTRAAWDAQGLLVPKIGLNLSARRLKEMNVARMLEETPGMAGCIVFELLETIDLDSMDSVSLRNIEDLKQAGIAIEIDDFGTGHTSILSLVRMQPRRIKIDKDLVLPAPQSATAQDLIRSVVSIARTLGIGVTAEGVETEAHATLLGELGCDTLQGYALARPMPADEVLCHLGRGSGHAPQALPETQPQHPT